MDMPEYVKKILTALETAGYEAWCVGGCVRDALLNRAPEDWDVTTSALPEATMAVFGERALPTGLKHGTVSVRDENGKLVEVTTYRVDGAYLDHRRPESVTFTRSIDEDLARRDFTINAMAVNLRGEFRDPFNGRDDLQKKVLRCVGDPDKRFQEDALRILRGMRFAAVLDLEEDHDTDAAMDRNRDLLKEIAPERIQVELTKLLCGINAGWVLENHPTILGVFWPEILPMVGFDQRNHHHCYDVWQHSLKAMMSTPATPELRCAALLHDIGKPPTFTQDANGVGHFYGHANVSVELADAMLQRLKYPTAFRERVTRLIAWHDRSIPRTDKSIRRALQALGEQDLRLLLTLKRADNLAQAPAYHTRQQELTEAEQILTTILTTAPCFTLKHLAVTGHDLLPLGYTGPALGQALNHLLDLVIDGEVPNERGALLACLRRPPFS